MAPSGPVLDAFFERTLSGEQRTPSAGLRATVAGFRPLPSNPVPLLLEPLSAPVRSTT